MAIKKITFSILIVFNVYFVFGQNLSIDETTKYINDLLDSSKTSCFFQMKIDNKGKITLTYIYKQTDGNFYEGSYTYFYIEDIGEIRMSKSIKEEPAIEFICKNDSKCINTRLFNDDFHTTSLFNITCINEEYKVKKGINAFKHLINTANKSKAYKRRDDDPFAPSNFKK